VTVLVARRVRVNADAVKMSGNAVR